MKIVGEETRVNTSIRNTNGVRVDTAMMIDGEEEEEETVDQDLDPCQGHILDRVHLHSHQVHIEGGSIGGRKRRDEKRKRGGGIENLVLHDIVVKMTMMTMILKRISRMRKQVERSIQLFIVGKFD